MSAPEDLALQCRCGAVRGVAKAVAPSAGNHAICYCHDCQAFAHFLGRAADVLDANAGTDIFQISPARLTFTAGAERIACMRLTPRGLLRWYAGCCNTPIGNTLATSAVPFIGIVRARLCSSRFLASRAHSGARNPLIRRRWSNGPGAVHGRAGTRTDRRN